MPDEYTVSNMANELAVLAASGASVRGTGRHIDAASLPDRTKAEIDPAPRLTLPWLIRLRWAALAAQLLLISVGTWQGWLPSATAVWALVGLSVLSNLALMLADRLPAAVGSRTLLGGALVVDVVLLTGILLLTGGPSNPLTMLYLVNVTLAAVTLGAEWAWAIVLTAAASYAALFAWHVPLPPQASHASSLPSHLVGMWLAFGATASLIAFFVTGVTRTLGRRERELEEMRLLAARHERLASLTALAAGAAHELATPLASIAVAARELERAAAEPAMRTVLEDAHLISSQVDRCRRILDQMSGRATGETVEPSKSVPVSEILALVAAALEPNRRARLVTDEAPAIAVSTQPTALVEALLNVVRNAFDASGPDAPVWIGARLSDGDRIEFAVRDRGTGMAPDVLARASEPFFTTKAPGAGFGLGLFLVQHFADRHEGALRIESAADTGTTVVLELPLDSAA